MFYPLRQTKRQRLMNAIMELPGLVAYYPMNETSGTIAKNYALATKGTNDGAIVGATIGQSGKIGKSYSYDGSGDRVTITNNASITPTTAITLGAIFRKTNDVGIESGILSNSGGAGQFGAYNLIIKDVTGNDFARVEIDLATTGAVSILGTTQLQSNVDYMLIGTYDKANIRLYLNGLQESSIARTNDIDTTARDTKIGDHANQIFTGKIQHAFICNQAISPGQVKELAQLGGFI